MILRWHEEALREAKAAAAFYREKQPGLEKRFLDTLEDALARIRRHPNLYRQIETNIRKCKLPRFPYGVVYRIQPGHIEIVAVVHMRRAPGYWKRRS